MRSVEEASNAMALDGIIFEVRVLIHYEMNLFFLGVMNDVFFLFFFFFFWATYQHSMYIQGAPVKVRRPSDYNPSLAATLGPSQPSQNLNLAAVGLSPGSSGGLEGPDRIFVGGLPYYFTEVQIRELLESFGPLRGFDLVKDRETGNSKGYAFCVYQDIAVTDIACAALNGIKMGDKTLTVRRANQGSAQPRPEQESVLLQAQQQVAIQVSPWLLSMLYNLSPGVARLSIKKSPSLARGLRGRCAPLTMNFVSLLAEASHAPTGHAPHKGGVLDAGGDRGRAER